MASLKLNAKTDPINVMDLHATIYCTMGIRSDFAVDVEKHPFFVTDLGQGKVRKDILDS